MVAVVIVGFLAIVGTRAFSGKVTESSKAQAMFETCDKISTNHVMLASAAGVSSAVTGSPLVTGSNTLLDALIGGVSNFNTTAYPNAWQASGIVALTNAAQGAAGSYNVSGFQLTYSGGGASPHACEYAKVPDEITQVLVIKYGAGITPLAPSDQSNGVIRYTTLASDNTRTVTILRQQ